MLHGASQVVHGLPAITILRLTPDRPVNSRPAPEIEAEELILTAVEHPPRVGETRSISMLIPEVLARYGLGESAASSTPGTPQRAFATGNSDKSIDLLA